MEAFLIGAAVVAAIILILVLVALAPLAFKGRQQPAGGNPPPAATPPAGGVTPPAATNPTPPATGGIRAFFSNLSAPHIPLWVWGTALVLVGLKFFGKDLPWAEILEFAKEYWIILLLACVFITGMVVGDPEDSAKLTKAVIIALLIYVGLKYGGQEVLELNYGPEYKEVLREFQEENIAKAKGLKKQDTGSATVQGSTVMIQASDTEWTEPLRLSGPYSCFRHNVVKYGLPKAHVQVATRDQPEKWIDLVGVQEISVAWVRYKSKGPGPTEVQHELLPKALCN